MKILDMFQNMFQPSLFREKTIKRIKGEISEIDRIMPQLMEIVKDGRYAFKWKTVHELNAKRSLLVRELNKLESEESK